MALQAFTDGFDQNVGTVNMQGSFTDDFNNTKRCSFQWGQGSFGNQTSSVDIADYTGSYDRDPIVPKDVTIRFRAKVFPVGDSQDVVYGDSSGDFKTFANVALFPSGLTPGVPTTNSCPVTGSVNPKTTESTGNVYIEYRKQGTSTWLEIGTPVATGLSGDSSIGLGGSISGLLPGTIYEARYKIIRNTENSVINYSAVGTFTTVGSSNTVVSSQIMLCTAQVFAPSILSGLPGVSNVIITPVTIEALGEMFLPAVFISQQSVIEIFVQFNDVIIREAIFG